MSELSDIVAKLTTDVDAKLADFATKLSAAQASVDALTAQVATLQANEADVIQAVTDLTALRTAARQDLDLLTKAAASGNAAQVRVARAAYAATSKAFDQARSLSSR